jgi:CDP-diacylglycerol--serine O-phosphatidyltransferase
VKIVKHPHAEARRRRRRERVLKTVAVLPSLATLGNLVCGLGAIYFCMLHVGMAGAARPPWVDPDNVNRLSNFLPTFLALGAYLIAAAMFFDALDGRLARLTRSPSEFGGQLDSLADVVSFGVAPAILVLTATVPREILSLGGWERAYWRAEWVMAAVFTCCAALRLARFNVENVVDEAAHMGFRGLPSPGAAGAIMSLVILHQDLLRGTMPWAHTFVMRLLPPFALCLGLLMVSRFRYPHLVNTILRGKRPFRQVVAIVIVVLVALVIQFQLSLAVVAAAYALSGPVNRIFQRARHEPIAEDETEAEDVISGVLPEDGDVDDESDAGESNDEDTTRSVG